MALDCTDPLCKVCCCHSSMFICPASVEVSCKTPWASTPTDSSGLHRRASVLRPVQPAPPVLRNIHIAILPRRLGRQDAPHASFAVEDDLLILCGFVHVEAMAEIVVREGEGLGRRRDGHVDCGGDVAVGVFARLADVCAEVLVMGWAGWSPMGIPMMIRSGDGFWVKACICVKAYSFGAEGASVEYLLEGMRGLRD